MPAYATALIIDYALGIVLQQIQGLLLAKNGWQTATAGERRDAPAGPGILR
jgi:hypothetical protein